MNGTASGGDHDGSERGVSPLIGLVLLFGLVAAGAILIALTGISAVDSVQSDVSQERGEQVMSQFDADLHTALIDGDASESVYLAEEGTYELSNSTLSVSISNGYSAPKTIDDIELGTLEYDDGEGNRIGHQAGGVWRVEGNGSTVVSEPDIRYYRERNEEGDEVGRIDLSVTSLQGEVGNGEHRIETLEQGEPASIDDAIDEVGFVDEITLTVSETPYHDAWKEFLKDEFDAVEVDDCDAAPPDTNVVCHDPTDQEVTVVATIDTNNPFADHVGIEPTVYGGLYAEEVNDNYNGDITVKGYDNHSVGTNSSDDLMVINDDLTMTGATTIEAVPVLNGRLDKTGGAPDVSQITYAGALDPSSPPADYEFINTTADGNTAVYWLDGDRSDNLVANTSSTFDPVDPIDDELETAVEDLEHLESTGGADDATGKDDLEAGLYYGSSLDPSSIDTGDGDVHVGTDGPVTLSDLEIEGGNSTYLYADGPVTIEDEVTIEDDDRAHALWVYGNSGDEITIEEDFDGVVYAPGSEVEIKNNVEITGAVIAGEVKLGPHATINFDRSLRTDVPIPEENREIEVIEVGTRDPLDVTFVLDRSGSMGPGNPSAWGYYTPDSYEYLSGTSWQPIQTDDPFRNYWSGTGSDKRIELRDENGNTTVLEPTQGARSESWDEIRVHPDDCVSCGTYIATYPNAGNDPDKLRVDATRDFIGMLNETEDRAGVYEFATASDTQALQELTDDLEKAEESVAGNEFGGTNIAAGMDRALDDYRTTPADGNERVMILLSDGENSDPSNDAVARNLAKHDADDLNVTIYTVGLGFDDLNEDLLEDIAEETGGRNVNVDDAEELEDVFGEIGEDVTAESDFSFDVGPVPDSASGSSEYVIDIDEHSVLIED